MVSRLRLPLFRRRFPRRPQAPQSSTAGRLAEPHLACGGRTPWGVRDEPPTAAVRRLMHPSVCVPGQGSWPIQPISCPGKAARALRHVRYTPSSRSRRSKISDPPTSPLLLGPLLPASTGFESWPIPYFSGFDSTRFLLHLIFPLPFRHRACLAFSPYYQVSSCLSHSAIFLFPATDQQCCLDSIPRTLSCPKLTIPSLVIAGSVCYIRKRR